MGRNGATAAVLVALVALHRPDGGVVLINPDSVTSLHAPQPRDGGKLLPWGACAIWLTDGRLVTVREPCAVVQRLLEDAAR